MSKVGETLPDATVFGKDPSDAIKVREACAGKKCVIVGVPGAFTPTCSDYHLPGFLGGYDDLKALNVDLIAFVAVNDAFVMTAWGKDRKVEDKIAMWADVQMELTKGLDVVLPAAAKLGNDRCQRFALVADDNVIKAFFVEEDPSKATVTSAASIMQWLKSA